LINSTFFICNDKNLFCSLSPFYASGYNSMDCFTGGFIFGANGSGLITPRFDGSPSQSGVNTPGRFINHPSNLTQTGINAAFNQRKEGISIDA
jgi:hypothetical protein